MGVLNVRTKKYVQHVDLDSINQNPNAAHALINAKTVSVPPFVLTHSIFVQSVKQ